MCMLCFVLINSVLWNLLCVICSLIKGMTPKMCMLCFVLINSILWNLLCVICSLTKGMTPKMCLLCFVLINSVLWNLLCVCIKDTSIQADLIRTFYENTICSFNFLTLLWSYKKTNQKKKGEGGTRLPLKLLPCQPSQSQPITGGSVCNSMQENSNTEDSDSAKQMVRHWSPQKLHILHASKFYLVPSVSR